MQTQQLTQSEIEQLHRIHIARTHREFKERLEKHRHQEEEARLLPRIRNAKSP